MAKRRVFDLPTAYACANRILESDKSRIFTRKEMFQRIGEDTLIKNSFDEALCAAMLHTIALCGDGQATVRDNGTFAGIKFASRKLGGAILAASQGKPSRRAEP